MMRQSKRVVVGTCAHIEQMATLLPFLYIAVTLRVAVTYLNVTCFTKMSTCTETRQHKELAQLPS